MPDCSPSIPGFCFPTTTVSGVSDAVAASGTEVSKSQVQGTTASGLNSVIASTGFDSVMTVGQFSGFDVIDAVRAFQGAGGSGQTIVAKLPGTSAQGSFLVYNNIVQNSSFETGINRWQIFQSAGHSADTVARFPGGRGFDNGLPADLDVPHGERMLHIIKAGETGFMSVFQDVYDTSHTSFLRNFSFSVAADSAFAVEDDPASRNAAVVLQFINNNSTVYTLAYNFTSAELPKFPTGFPSLDRTISLSHIGSDKFQRFTRDLTADVLTSSDFTRVRIWIVTDMQDTLFAAEFDTLWDWFVLETGQNQPDLFPTSTEQEIIVTSTAETVRTKNFLGVLGTRETYERDFDRSPFFFTPSELDPNTVRDRTEIEPFILFSKAFLRTYESSRAIPHTGQVIASKGDLFSSDQQAPDNVIANGSFETGTTAFWQTDPPVSGTNSLIEVRGESLADGGGIPGGTLPPDGNHWLYLIKDDTGTGSTYIRQLTGLSRTFSSTVIRKLSWSAAFDNSNDGGRHNQFSLVFYNNNRPVYHLRYGFGFQGLPSLPVVFPDAPVSKSITLTATTGGVINNYLRQFSTDTVQAIFDFDRVEIWWITGSANVGDTNTYVDDFALTMAIPSTELLKTSEPAHIIFENPVPSGLPFAVSGSDTVNQIDQTPPFFDETLPASGTSFNPTAGVLSFHVKDVHSELDTTNIDVWADDVQIVNASVVQTGTVWPVGNRIDFSTKDIQYDFTRVSDYPQQSTVTISGELTDLANPSSNQSITDYQFTVLGSGTLEATISGSVDGDPPGIVIGFPSDLDTQISPDVDISWSVTDNASGVDPATVRLLINGFARIENDLAIAGSFSRVANAQRGFDYIYQPNSPFAFGQTITGTIEATDFVGNFNTSTYEFTITPDDTLSITNFFMAQGSSILTNSGTEISVCIEDSVHGVSVSRSFILANGLTPAGLIVTTSGAGPDKITYSFPASGTVDSRTDVDILVHAENDFPGPFPVIKEQAFVLRPGFDVEWPNRAIDVGFGAESVFPFTTNIHVLTEVSNFGKNFNKAGLFYRFSTESQHRADLGASLTSNIKEADLPATLNSLNTIFEYGKTIVLEVEVADNEGNQLSFIHTFTIEDKPN